LAERLRYRRRQRLQTAEVGAVLAAGRRLRGQPLSLQLRGNGLGIARLGLIVPKRHLPRAVDRNRVKRVLREWFRHHQASLEGRDLLVRLTSPASEPAQILDEMERLLPAPETTSSR
jgi:ribonuclease P protein component